MLITDILKELSIMLGMPIFQILSLLAIALLIATGIFFTLVIGTRKVFIFGILPIMLGVIAGIFPIYFLIIGIIIASFVGFTPLPKHISYKDRIVMMEAEIYLEYLGAKDKK